MYVYVTHWTFKRSVCNGHFEEETSFKWLHFRLQRLLLSPPPPSLPVNYSGLQAGTRISCLPSSTLVYVNVQVFTLYT